MAPLAGPAACGAARLVRVSLGPLPCNVRLARIAEFARVGARARDPALGG
jgi:hypothetical protein